MFRFFKGKIFLEPVSLRPVDLRPVWFKSLINELKNKLIFLLVCYLFCAHRKVVETGSLYHFSKKARDSKLLPESSFLGGVIPTLGCHSHQMSFLP